MGAQVSIFDILNAKTYVIHYFDARGIRHTEDLTTSDLKTDVRRWRKENKNKYFQFLEAK